MDFGKIHLQIEIYHKADIFLMNSRNQGLNGLKEIGEIKDMMVIPEKNILADGDVGKHSKLALMVKPAIILKSLKIEIALKGLAMKFEGVDTIREHSLERIFVRILPKFQKLIKEEVCDKLKIDEHEFDEHLKTNSNHFIEWRYSFEKDLLEANVEFLDAFFEAVYARFKQYCLGPPKEKPDIEDEV